MKGLLIKDIQIAMKQKTIFLIWFAVSIIFLFTNQDPVFSVSYSLFLMIIMLTGTISYDDFDNGMGFLMTLPISRKLYVVEKYVLVFGGTLLTGSFVSLISVGYLMIHPEVMTLGEFGTVCLMLYAVMSILGSVYIPFQLKYGAEKGRVMLVLVAAIVCGGLFAIRQIKNMPAELEAVFLTVSEMNPVVLAIGFMIVAILAAGISLKISIRIVEKEEY